MLEGWIINIVITFVVRQITKWGSEVDFEKIKLDIEPRIRAILPGDFLDDEAVSIMFFVIDKLSSVSNNAEALTGVFAAVAAKDMKRAIELLKELVRNSFALDSKTVSLFS